MNSVIRSKITPVLILAFVIAVATAVVAQVASARSSAESDSPTTFWQTAASSTGEDRRFVTIYLTDNSFLAKIPNQAEELLSTTQGTTAARRAAQRNPAKRSSSELVAASIAENSRNAALPFLRTAAARSVAQLERVRRYVAHLGGTYVTGSVIPSQITASVPAHAVAQLRQHPSVLRVTNAAQPVLMAAPIDGHEPWWSGGYFGQGFSADGKGSPDAVVFDTGIRTTHTAFNSRLPEDGPSENGSGPPRVISSAIRSDHSGSKHANTIGAAIGATDLGNAGGGGIAYGLDKLYDNYEAANPPLWDLGITTSGDPGLGGGNDLPEVINYSAGVYEDTTDLNPFTSYWDALESRFGILNTVAAGNCGVATPSFSDCADGPHRVATPGNNPNVFTVGGLDTSTVYPDTSGYVAWANTSPGPTWGGRKKPDVIAPVFGTAGTPSETNDTTFTSGGQGTSYAAPIAAAGAVLLASGGVYAPTAQKAIMINSATPVQGQTYWMPRTGWGALNLSNAFYQRGNYANASVTGSGANSARFFQITGVSSGDRSTLVWNRRTSIDSNPNPSNGQILGPAYFNLTNLDLSQFNPATLSLTATGGSDAADTVDTDQIVTADNPMPGDGTDGGDNVEQIRSTGTGTQVLKVKSHSAIDGLSSEPFSLASANPITALSTPIPNVTLTATPSPVGFGESVTVTASVTNPSPDLPLESATASLTLPSGVTLDSGTNPAALGTISASGTATATWTVDASSSGAKNLTSTVSGTTYGESFSGNDDAAFVADGLPPVVTLNQLPQYSTTASPSVSWSATDAESAVATYDIETSPDGTTWNPLILATTSTSSTITGAEGQTIHVRVRARDTVGNESDWSTTQTTIDAIEPAIEIGAPSSPSRGELRVPVSVSNVGAPITQRTYTFATSTGGTTGPLLSPTVTFTNNGTKSVTPTLDVRVTDAIGRHVFKSQSFVAPPRWIQATIKISTAKIKGGKLRVTGTLGKEYAGRVTVTVKPRSTNGTKKSTKRVRAKSGRFTADFSLRKGTYRVTVNAPASGPYLTASNSKNFAVR